MEKMMESPTAAHHCSPLISFCPVLSFSSSPPLTWGHTSTMGLAWPHQEQHTYFIDFPDTAPRIEGNCRTGARSGPVHRGGLQKHLVPPQCSHIGKLKSRERKGLSQNHITTIRVRSSDSLSSVFFSVKFFESLPPKQSKSCCTSSSCLVIYVASWQPEAKRYFQSGVLS